MNKILWINDDFTENKNRYKELWEDVGELIMTKEFKLIDNIDFVIVDYGCLNNTENANVLKKYHINNISIIWTGGFGGTDKYPNDVRRMFPKEKWMHEIESIDLGCLREYVYQKLKN